MIKNFFKTLVITFTLLLIYPYTYIINAGDYSKNNVNNHGKTLDSDVEDEEEEQQKSIELLDDMNRPTDKNIETIQVEDDLEDVETQDKEINDGEISNEDPQELSDDDPKEKQEESTNLDSQDDLENLSKDNKDDPPYKNGDNSEGVIELKKNLTRLGIGNYPEDPSPRYGDSTERNVKTFQEYYDLEPTGVADEDTLSKIDEILSSDYQDGKEGDHVVELKKNLTRLGIGNYPKDPSPRYGDSTDKNVREFQEIYGLHVNGIADEVTLAKIDELLDVITLKKNLTRLGIGNYPEDPSPRYGNSTERNVKTFQEYYDLEPTGVADEDTLSKIDEILSSDYQDGKEGDHVVELKKNLTRLGIGNYPKDPSPRYGDSTDKNVREFQEYYNLLVHGIADQKTLNKIDEILSSDYQDGKEGDHVVELKKNLKRLGFGNYPKDPSPRYGNSTERNVKAFQEYYGLNVNGIADEITLNKIEEILSSPYQNGQRGNHIIKLKKNLSRLGIGNYPKNPSPKFGSSTEKNVKEFQKSFGLKISGIADEVTLAKIEEMLSALDKTKYDITLGDAVNIQMEADPQTDSSYAWVSKSYIKNDKVTASELNVRKGPGTNYGTLGTLSKGKKVKILDEYNDWYVIEYSHNEWVHSSPSDVRYYLNPENFINDEKQQFQFLDLAKPSGASAKDLNKFLKGRGILEGKGQAFIDAAEEHDINDIYLISHALLETGNGTSKLAKGVKHKGKTVYNMYGIGAYDDCAVDCGAKKAYEEGWTSPEKAIIGGATFIGNSYIKAGQNTLYKMRWNPDAMANTGKTSHQYATDVGWASKQITTMYDLYQSIEDFKLQLDVPVYK